MHWFYVLHVAALLLIAIWQFRIQKRLDRVSAAADQISSLGDIDV